MFQYKRTKEWKKEQDIDDEKFGNSVYRCNMDISRNFTTLLAVICSSDPDVCLFLGEYASQFTESMLNAMMLKDRVMNQVTLLSTDWRNQF